MPVDEHGREYTPQGLPVGWSEVQPTVVSPRSKGGCFWLIAVVMLVGLGIPIVCGSGGFRAGIFDRWRQEPSAEKPAPPRPDADTPELVRPYVGEYSRHGQSMRIDADGYGVFRSRSYVACPAPDPGTPCEEPGRAMPIEVRFTLVGSGGAVVARITSSNADGFTADMPISMPEPGIVSFSSLEFCNPEIVAVERDREVCGA